MVCFKAYPLKFFKDCLPQNLLEYFASYDLKKKIQFDVNKGSICQIWTSSNPLGAITWH